MLHPWRLFSHRNSLKANSRRAVDQITNPSSSATMPASKELTRRCERKDITLPSPSELHKIEFWRKRAEEARTLAQQMLDAEAKILMMGVAESYEQIAKNYEQIAELKKRISKLKNPKLDAPRDSPKLDVPRHEL
jgi:hypothetical protein